MQIEDVAPGGKALARIDGRVVFVDRGLAGDVVEARLTKVKRTFAEARLERVVEPSPSRIPARCPHVERCGGCRLQELPYEEQCALKARHVRELLVHLGGMASPDVRPLVPAPSAWRYRNKMEFSFAPGEGGRPLLGMHERGTFDRVFELRTCELPSELTLAIVRLTQETAITNAWPAYHPSRHEGNVRFLTVRHLPLTGQCAVHLIAADPAIHGLEAWAQAVAALSPEVRTVTLGLQRSRANVAIMEEERALVGDGVIEERLLGLTFEVVGNAFLQTNSLQAEALYRAALAEADPSPDDSVLDLYCGAGTLSLLFARAAGRVVGVENVPEAIVRAGRNARRNEVANVRFVCGDSRAVLREWARGERPERPAPEIVVVDPPRAGLHPRVVARIAELGPRRIVYVSCNPATLARDLKDFGALGWRLEHVTPFDMFPHTPHIECVARLAPA